MVPVRGMRLLVPDQRGQSVAENEFDAFIRCIVIPLPSSLHFVAAQMCGE